LKAISIAEGYQYLGNLDSAANQTCSTLDILKKGVENLTKASLKPQQRLYIIRTNLLPRLLHTAVLGRLSKNTLIYLDKITRAAVSCWLRLPKDTHTGFFHASYRDGGLDLPVLKLVVPILRTKRMARLAIYPDPVVRAVSEMAIFQQDFRRWSAPLSAYGVPIQDMAGIKTAMGKALHESVDGRGLRESRNAGYVNTWMVTRTAMLSGNNFVQCLKLNGNLMYTALRATRDRPDRDARCGIMDSRGWLIMRAPVIPVRG